MTCMDSLNANNKANAEQESLVSFKDVSFCYPEQTANALNGVNLELRRGEFLVVLGANGSGKSTLAKHMNALLLPCAGEVTVRGMSTSESENAFPIRQHCGMVFQNPDNQSVASIVEDDVAFGPENLELAPEQIQSRVHDALLAVGMLEHAKDEVAFLSGGQKQRVAIAGALAMRPELLVLDEPSSMLDVAGRAQLMHLLEQLHASGITIVLITHDVNEALRAGRIIVMDAGHIALEGAPKEVLAHSARLDALGLELPFQAKLQQRLDELADLNENDDEHKQGTRTERQHEHAVGSNSSVALTLKLENASFSYSDDDEAKTLRGINLQVRPGSVLGIIGPTGSGKSTLLQLMAGLEAPQEGRAYIAKDEMGGVPVVGSSIASNDGNLCDSDVTSSDGNTRRMLDTGGRANTRSNSGSIDKADLRRLTGLVFQYPEQQLFASSVIDDVAFGPTNRGAKKADAKETAARALKRCGFDPKQISESSPYALSGGQQRRVALAGTLAMEPRFLLLDEPCAGLDPRAREELFSLIDGLKKEGLSIVLVTHSMEDAAQHCDALAVLGEGEIRLYGTPREVFSSQNTALLEKLSLDLPWPVRYAIEHEIPGNPLSIDELASAISADRNSALKDA